MLTRYTLDICIFNHPCWITTDCSVNKWHNSCYAGFVVCKYFRPLLYIGYSDTAGGHGFLGKILIITNNSFHYFIQTELNEMIWRAIREDLNSVEAINDVLLVLDVVVGFLSSAGGDPEQKLSSYLQDVLKYSQTTHGTDHLPGKRVCIISSIGATKGVLGWRMPT